MKQYTAVFLLMLLLAPAAFADVELYSIDTPDSTSITSASLNSDGFEFIVKDVVSFANNVTRVEMIGLTGYKADNLTKTYTNMPVSHAGAYYGNATITWTWSPAGTYSGQGDIIITFNDFASKGLTGVQGFKIESAVTRNWRVYEDGIGTSFGSMNESQYAIRMWGEVANGTYTIYGSAPIGPPAVDYSCNFADTTQATGFNLDCGDASETNPALSSYEWNLHSPDNSTYTTTTANLTRTLNAVGWWGLEYQACNSYGCGYKNTSFLLNTIEGYAPVVTGINITVHTYDAQKSAKVAPSNINIQNTSSGTWSNWTATGGTMTFRSTDVGGLHKLSVGQVVKLCGYAEGYAQTCGNLTLPYNNFEYTINLIGTSALPTAGNTTLIVNVIDGRTATRIPGATITISNTSAPYSSSKLGDANGVATFSNIPAVAAYQISASKAGYQSSTRYWPVASGEVSNAYISIIPVGATPVPTTGSGDPIYEPTPTLTDEHGNPIIPGVTTVDTRTAEEKDDDMMDMLRDDGPTLIQFFLLCFVLYMIMGIGGRK